MDKRISVNDKWSMEKVAELVAHWLLVPGNRFSNPSEEDNFSSFVFESQSHDCH